MREPPANLADDTLYSCLRAGYGLDPTELTFLPLGHDASAWVYRMRAAAGRVYFLKVRLSVTNEVGLTVPRFLHDHGVARVIAPLPTTTGTLWTTAGDYALILYPFIAGVTGMERGMSDRQWVDYGALLRQVHDAAVTPELARLMRRDTFTPNGADLLRRLDAHLGASQFDDPAEQALAAFWQAHQADIQLLLGRAEDLGRRLAAMEPELVLCHADIHTANVLLDNAGQVWFVDWDETMLAPRERDLMFVVGGISCRLVGPREEELFFQGYGAATIAPLALAYYRYAWAVSDISEYGAQVCFRPDFGPVTRRAGLDGFLSMFQPGEIVSLAFASDTGAAA
ncbi:MAG: phosphotransferase [Thermomicrobiales bacterium]